MISLFSPHPHYFHFALKIGIPPHVSLMAQLKSLSMEFDKMKLSIIKLKVIENCDVGGENYLNSPKILERVRHLWQKNIFKLYKFICSQYVSASS